MADCRAFCDSSREISSFLSAPKRMETMSPAISGWILVTRGYKAIPKALVNSSPLKLESFASSKSEMGEISLVALGVV